MMKKSIFLCLLFILMLTVSAAAQAETAKEESFRYPGATWMKYAEPEEAGWSSQMLEVVEDYCDMIDTAAVLVIYKGAVVFHWGDIERKFMCHSVRKSFLNSIFGIHVYEGSIDLNKTIEELGIDDVPPLTQEEKQARVIHLLKSRSGVYHEAAYESVSMKASRPERGSHAPDTFYYYNNWDFNTLGTIFNQETGKDLFEEFRDRIAVPLQMEDFIMEEDTYYHYELQYSIHPAYPFTMSARDMARFGYLYLRNGKWKDQQIIPTEWITESAFPYSVLNSMFGYGYLWWVLVHPDFQHLEIYFASGYRGHKIFVVPGADLVMVHRVNTYYPINEVSFIQIMIILDMILQAQVSNPKEFPILVPLNDRLQNPKRPTLEQQGKEKPKINQ